MASLTQAQNNVINQTGQSKQNFESPSTFLDKAGQKFMLAVLKNIRLNKDMIVSGAIENMSISVKDNQLIITGAKELVYQSRGVNGSKKKLYNTVHSYSDKRPPVSVFYDWVKRRNLQKVNEQKKFGSFAAESPFKDKTSDSEINSLAWAIATKVYQEGFKPRNLIEKPTEQLIKEVKKQYADFVIQQIKLNVKLQNPSTQRNIIK